eukprot:gene38979-47418_t
MEDEDFEAARLEEEEDEDELLDEDDDLEDDDLDELELEGVDDEDSEEFEYDEFGVRKRRRRPRLEEDLDDFPIGAIEQEVDTGSMGATATGRPQSGRRARSRRPQDLEEREQPLGPAEDVVEEPDRFARHF